MEKGTMNRELDVVFLGGLYPKHMYEEIYAKSIKGMQNAANTLQWNIVDGLDANLNKPVSILNLMFVGSYPKKYKDLIINSFSFSHTDGAKDFNIGFLNLTGIKQFILNIVSKRYLNKWLSDGNRNKKVLIIYSAQPFFLEVAKYVKKINKDVSICLVVPDLPIYMGLHQNRNILRKLYKKYQVNKVNHDIKYIDSFVFLTEYMRDYFNINKPYVTIEGMVSSEYEEIDLSLNVKKNDSIKTILYTGTLTKKYGVLDLVNAFISIRDESYRLIICGDGEAKEEIIHYSKNDPRIIFKGLLPHDQIKIIQRQATLLVNPRKNNDEYTKYSFPSKLMEYLASGTPVVTYKLDGIPQEYDNFLIYFEDDTHEGMIKKIVEICEKKPNELEEIGVRNKEFITSQKNNFYQANKIVKMIKGSDKHKRG
jgi:glycosyltransferase involved in cell wall biosynthesis